MKKYKIWYDPIEEKYYLKFDGENKIEVTKKQFLLLEEEINIVAEAIIKQGYPCVESLAERIRRNNKMKKYISYRKNKSSFI